MSKIVLIALIAFVAIQLSHAAPKPEETASAKSEVAEVTTKSADPTTLAAEPVKPQAVARETEVKVGVDAVEAVEKSTAAAVTLTAKA